MDKKKPDLLRSLHLLDRLSDKQREELGRFLKAQELKDEEVLFEQGSKGSSLFFVAEGHIRIAKRLSGKRYKDLAILGPGDCFGEMALLEETARSARAAAQGKTLVFELSRKDLDKWLKSNPELVVEFFAELVQVQSRRLRRTSDELAMLADLSGLLLGRQATAQELLPQVLGRVLPHLAGSWAAAAYLYNSFNDEMDFVAKEGDFDLKTATGGLPPPAETRSLWVDPRTYYVSLPGPQRPLGYLVFRSQSELELQDQNELGRTLATVARLVTSAVENIGFRSEETLRARLRSASHGSSL